MKFVRKNWFKISIIILFIWLLVILNNGLNIEVRHKGYIESERERGSLEVDFGF